MATKDDDDDGEEKEKRDRKLARLISSVVCAAVVLRCTPTRPHARCHYLLQNDVVNNGT